MKRRNFIITCAALVVGATAVGWGWLRRSPPARWIVAVRAGRYPGLVRPLDRSEMKKPGKWIG